MGSKAITPAGGAQSSCWEKLRHSRASRHLRLQGRIP